MGCDLTDTGRVLCLLTLAFGLLGNSVGCRGRAYREIYAEKLSSRVRVLEDELYAAEYEIKVLRDQLARERGELATDQAVSQRRGPQGLSKGFQGSGNASERIESRDNSSANVQIDPPSVPGRGLPEESSGSEHQNPPQAAEITPSIPEIPDLDDLDIDPGQPLDELMLPDVPPIEDGELSPPSLSSPIEGNSLPPTQPVPPSTNDLLPPPIDLGDPAPPASGDGMGEELPPGKITTPNTARTLLPLEPSIPRKISLHPGLTGRHHQNSDDIVDGVYAVLTIEDQYGQPMRTAAPVSFVVLDPNREGENARIGRWDLTAETMQQSLRESPLTSFHVPLLWQDGKSPVGNEIALFVRVMLPSGEKLEAELLLELETQVALEWRPQGLGTGLQPNQRRTELPVGMNREDLWR